MNQQPQEPPLCVDLDGTLIRTNLLYETLIALVKKNPFYVLALPLWLLRGRAFFKRAVASRVRIDIASLPYYGEVVRFLRAEKARGRSLHLVTACDDALATAVAGHLGMFDGVVASDGHLNMKGEVKARTLCARFGTGGFDYVGDSTADLPVWRVAQGSVLVGGAASLAVSRDITVVRRFPGRPVGLKTFAKEIRIHQWLKNVLLFIPMIMAHKYLDAGAWWTASLAFFSFSLCASGVYLVNDLLDLESDRVHAQKKHRPLANGDLSIPAGVVLAVLFFFGSIAIAVLLPVDFVKVLGFYFFVTLVYSFRLKKIMLVDVMTLVVLYALRFFAGALVAAAPLSHWFLAFFLFFFLSLAFAKRFTELVNVNNAGGTVNSARDYQPSDYDQIARFGASSAYLSIMVLALYINSEAVIVLYTHPERLWLLCPILLYWINRLWLLANRGRISEDPVLFAAKDPQSYVVGLLSVAVILLAGAR